MRKNGISNFPPRKLKLFDGNQQIPRNLPPRLLKDQKDKQQIFPRNPPRLLRKRQQVQAQRFSGHSISSIARQIHLVYQPCWFDLIMFQRASMQSFLMLQQQATMEQRSKMREKVLCVQERKNMEEMLKQQALMIERELCVRKERERMKDNVEEMLQQQPLMIEREFCVQEERKKMKEEENLAERISTVDYSRLTSFLEKDDSFLTPWSWKPKEKQQQPRRTENDFSFNVRNRWASVKEDTQTTYN